MSMHVLSTVIIIAILLGLFGSNIPISMAKQHHSSSEDSKAQADATTTIKDSTDSTKSDVLPITPVDSATVPPIISQAVGQPCSNAEDKTCTATVAPNTTTTPATTTTPPPTTNLVIPEDNSDSSSGSTTSSGGSGSSSSQSDEQDNQDVTTNSNRQDNRIDDASRYIIAAIPEGVGLYKVISGEETLSDSMQTIRPLKIYNSIGEAIADLVR